MPNPRYQNNEEQYTPTLGQYTKAYAPGLGAAMGIALMGLIEAASEMRKITNPVTVIEEWLGARPHIMIV